MRIARACTLGRAGTTSPLRHRHHHSLGDGETTAHAANPPPPSHPPARRLGGGNFGVTYEGVRVKSGESISTRAPLSDDQKARRVVLKRCNADGAGVRSDFLQAGTMA